MRSAIAGARARTAYALRDAHADLYHGEALLGVHEPLASVAARSYSICGSWADLLVQADPPADASDTPARPCVASVMRRTEAAATR